MARVIYWIPPEAVIRYHEELVEMFRGGPDPIEPPGLHDANLLESACGRPWTSLGDREKYPTQAEKAAALLHSLIKNHAFRNGNKRTALVATLRFLHLNGIRIDAKTDDDAIFRLITAIAANNFPTPDHDLAVDEVVQAIASWVRSHTTPVKERASRLRVTDFLNRCVAAGATWKKSGPSYVVSNGAHSIRLGQDTRQLDGPVVRKYLGKLGLSEHAAGILYDEFAEGLSDSQRVIRQYRNVLNRLADA